MTVKCKNCREAIFLDMSNTAFMNKAIYCEHCKKVVFYCELPFSLVLSVIKWLLVFIIIAFEPAMIFIGAIIWSILEKIFMVLSYKYLLK